MSGPIVRRYGFPNFDQIFGKKELEHGVEETKTPVEPAQEAAAPAGKPAEGQPEKAEKK